MADLPYVDQDRPQPVDIKFERAGDRIFSRDVFSDGQLGVIRTPWFPAAKSPEHAEVMAELLLNPEFTVWVSEGFFTDEKLDEIVTRLREIRRANSVRGIEP